MHQGISIIIAAVGLQFPNYENQIIILWIIRRIPKRIYKNQIYLMNVTIVWL